MDDMLTMAPRHDRASKGCAARMSEEDAVEIDRDRRAPLVERHVGDREKAPAALAMRPIDENAAAAKT